LRQKRKIMRQLSMKKRINEVISWLQSKYKKREPSKEVREILDDLDILRLTFGKNEQRNK